MENPTGRTSAVALIEAYLLESRGFLLGYVVGRVGDRDLAEDILQGSLLRAIRSSVTLRDEEKLVPWFRRIVDNAIVDTFRKRGRREALIDAYYRDHQSHADADRDAALCLCFRTLLPTLRKEYGFLIEALELEGRDPDEVARELGINRNNLNVRRHRARRQLRERLAEACAACPEDSFVGCECPENPLDTAGARGGG